MIRSKRHSVSLEVFVKYFITLEAIEIRKPRHHTAGLGKLRKIAQLQKYLNIPTRNLEDSTQFNVCSSKD